MTYSLLVHCPCSLWVSLPSHLPWPGLYCSSGRSAMTTPSGLGSCLASSLALWCSSFPSTWWACSHSKHRPGWMPVTGALIFYWASGIACWPQCTSAPGCSPASAAVDTADELQTATDCDECVCCTEWWIQLLECMHIINIRLSALGVVSLARPLASSPPFFFTNWRHRSARKSFCSEPPELGGSLICSCRGNNNIHIG